MNISPFQIALIVAGVVFVGIVWIVNLVQERRQRRLAEQVFSGQQPDVLVSGVRDQESGIRNQEDAHRAEPTLGDSSAAEAAHAVQTPLPPLPAELVDERVDCVVRFDLPAPVALPWDTLAATLSWVSGAARWLVFEPAENLWRQWDAEDEGDCAHVIAALQLCDRQGVVSDAVLDDFLAAAAQIAQQWQLPAPPPREAVLLRAKALDGFCAGVDVQLGINLLPFSGGEIKGEKVLAAAVAAGLRLGEDGRFHQSDENGRALFSLGNFDGRPFAAETLAVFAPAGLNFMLDVPRVAEGGAAFDQLLMLARQMAQNLGARLYDQHRKPLDEVMLAAIRNRVIELQQQMAASGIPAGSPLALRLFD